MSVVCNFKLNFDALNGFGLLGLLSNFNLFDDLDRIDFVDPFELKLFALGFVPFEFIDIYF